MHCFYYYIVDYLLLLYIIIIAACCCISYYYSNNLSTISAIVQAFSFFQIDQGEGFLILCLRKILEGIFFLPQIPPEQEHTCNRFSQNNSPVLDILATNCSRCLCNMQLHIPLHSFGIPFPCLRHRCYSVFRDQSRNID